MLNIYLCDDNQIQLSQLYSSIETEIKQNKYKMKVTLATISPTDVLNQAKASASKINMYFLDVDLNNCINGIELARQIRQFDPRAFIVIVTAYNEYMPLTLSYMIEPLAYILKGDTATMKAQIKDCLKLANDRYSSTIGEKIGTDYFTINLKNRSLDINTNDLYYITVSSIPHTLEICTRTKLTQARGSLSDMTSKLPDCFFKISRETIININHIKSFDTENRAITLKNDSLFHVSTRKFNELKKVCKI